MILDYNEVNKILDSFNNTSIKENEPLNYTENAKLPIRYFTLGNGNKHIVVTAAWHSNEIITTSFVIELMQYLINNNLIIRYRKTQTFPINHSKAVWNLPQMQQKNDMISICWMW